MTTQCFTFPFLAGLFDGDGTIRIYKSTGEYDVTTHQEDLALLEQLQSQFGGAIRKVANKKAVRWILNSKNAKNGRQTLVELTQGLNGHIRNSVRVEQFKQLCQALGIQFKAADQMSNKNGYIAGLFSSDGSVYLKARSSAKQRKLKQDKIEKTDPKSVLTLNKKTVLRTLNASNLSESKVQRLLEGVAPRAEISITNAQLANISEIPLAFGFGGLYFVKGNQRAAQGHHTFRIYKEKDILAFYDYMTTYPSASIKFQRLNLLKQIYQLKNEKAHLKDKNSSLKDQWEALIRRWFET